MVFIQNAGTNGRAFTDYRPACYVNESIKVQNGIKDNYNYRLFLQRNAEALMKTNAIESYKNKLICDCPKCNEASAQVSSFH
ncbi:hypothetical protein CCP3SC1AL1_630004 [Gammaproteobacteria bacterium]